MSSISSALVNMSLLSFFSRGHATVSKWSFLILFVCRETSELDNFSTNENIWFGDVALHLDVTPISTYLIEVSLLVFSFHCFIPEKGRGGRRRTDVFFRELRASLLHEGKCCCTRSRMSWAVARVSFILIHFSFSFFFLHFLLNSILIRRATNCIDNWFFDELNRANGVVLGSCEL